MDKEMTMGGKWNILDKEYPGDITFSEQNGRIVLSIYYKDKNEFTAWMNKPSEIETITGKLNQEIKCTLTDCKVVKRHSDRFVRHHILIVAESMFLNLSKKKKSLLKFNEIHFYIPNIIKWSKLSGFEFFYDKDYELKIGYKFKEKIVQKIDDNTTVEFVPYLGSFNYDMQIEKLGISQHVEIHIIKKKETTFDEFLKNFKMISDMITLATGSKISVARINGVNYKKYIKLGKRKRNYIKNEIITRSVKHDNVKNLDANSINNYLFDLNEIVKKKRLKKWFDSYQKFNTIYDLYNLGINNEVPDEIRFCNLMQGLELIHTKQFKAKAVNKFFKHIEVKFKDNASIIDLIKNNPDQGDDFIILKNRLIDLFSSEFALTSTEKIIDNIDNLSAIFSDTRNYYTHYNEAKKNKSLSGVGLQYGIYILEYLLSNYILLNLNFSIDEIDKIQEFQLTNIKNTRMIEKIISNK